MIEFKSKNNKDKALLFDTTFSKKKIYILIGAILIFFIPIFLLLPSSNKDYIKPIQAIPPSAGIIIKSNSTTNALKNIINSNTIWKGLIIHNNFKSINKTLFKLEKNILKYEKIQSVIENANILISIHTLNDESLGYLAAIPCEDEFDEDDIEVFLHHFYEKPFIYRDYNGSEIYENNKIIFTIYKGLLLISSNSEILEKSIKNINNKSVLLKDKLFQKIWSSKGKYVDFNIFINYHLAYSLTKKWFSNKYKNLVKNSMNGFSNWLGLDFNIKANIISLEGFSSSDMLSKYINIFKEQKAQNHNFLEIIPNNTISFLHFGLSNFIKYNNNYKEYLDKNNNLSNYEDYILNINNKYQINIEELLVKWINEEIGFFKTYDSKNNQNSFAFLKSNDTEFSNRKLNLLISKIALKENQSPYTLDYEGYRIHQIKIPYLLNKIFGDVFHGIINNYFIQIEEYYIFGNSPSSLKHIINSYNSQNVLYNNKKNSEFSENISNESNIFFYCKPDKEFNTYKKIFNTEIQKKLTQIKKNISNVDGISIQINYENENLFFHNIYLKYDSEFKSNSPNLLWKTEIEFNADFKPVILKNHHTNNNQILIQDKKNQLYLIDKDGKILWKISIEEPILSDVEQIDIYKNHKLQMVFNTKNYIYIIDRLGNYVKNFPIKLKSEASAPMSIFDYDRKKEYRFLIPCKNNKIYNYNTQGKITKGWNYKSTKSPTIRKLKHFIINRKDFIVTIQKNGDIQIINRRGEKRKNIEITQDFKISKNSDYYIEKGNNIKNTKIIGSNQKGEIIIVKLNNQFKKIKIRNFNTSHKFIYDDINNDAIPDYIYLEDDVLECYDKNLDLIYKRTFEDNILHFSNIYQFKGIKTGIFLKNEIFLIDEKGDIVKDFPMAGSSPFTIKDFKQDGVFELIVCGEKNYILAYSLK